MELQSDVDRFFSSDIHPHHSVNTSIIRLNVTFPSGAPRGRKLFFTRVFVDVHLLTAHDGRSAGGRDAKLKPKSFRYFCCFVSPRFLPFVFQRIRTRILEEKKKRYLMRIDKTSLTCNELFFSISTFSKPAVLNLRAGRFWPTRHMFDYISLYLMG